MRYTEKIAKVLLRAERAVTGRRSRWDGFGIALHDLKALYIVVPKVACSSLTAVCVDLLGFDLPEDAWKPGVFRGTAYDGTIDTARRDRAKVYRDEIGRYSDYFKFTFVRDPFTRLVSCFREKIRDGKPEDGFVDGVSRILLRYGVFHRGMDFAAFARAVADIHDEDADPHFRSQVALLTDRKGRLMADFVGRMESMGEDIARVGERLGREIRVPHLLKSGGNDVASFYDPVTRKIVRERYGRDFEAFGYS